MGLGLQSEPWAARRGQRPVAWVSTGSGKGTGWGGRAWGLLGKRPADPRAMLSWVAWAETRGLSQQVPSRGWCGDVCALPVPLGSWAGCSPPDPPPQGLPSVGVAGGRPRASCLDKPGLDPGGRVAGSRSGGWCVLRALPTRRSLSPGLRAARSSAGGSPSPPCFCPPSGRPLQLLWGRCHLPAETVTVQSGEPPTGCKSHAGRFERTEVSRDQDPLSAVEAPLPLCTGCGVPRELELAGRAGT